MPYILFFKNEAAFLFSLVYSLLHNDHPHNSELIYCHLHLALCRLAAVKRSKCKLHVFWSLGITEFIKSIRDLLKLVQYGMAGIAYFINNYYEPTPLNYLVIFVLLCISGLLPQCLTIKNFLKPLGNPKLKQNLKSDPDGKTKLCTLTLSIVNVQ